MPLYPFANPRIAPMVDAKQASKTFFFETVIGEFSSGYFINKMNDCLMIGSYVCGLNSELILHTSFAVRD